MLIDKNVILLACTTLAESPNYIILLFMKSKCIYRKLVYECTGRVYHIIHVSKVNGSFNILSIFYKPFKLIINKLFLTGQINTLTKLLKNEKTPLFRNLVLLPLLVQQEADQDIQVQK